MTLQSSFMIAGVCRARSLDAKDVENLHAVIRVCACEIDTV
jgi:hypothetical protein